MPSAPVTSAALMMRGMFRYDSVAIAGPMQTVSSAIARCMSSRSAVECTATVFNPSSLQARMMRSAISPRLAMSTFCIAASGSGSGDAEQGLIEFHRLAVVHQDGLDDTGLVRFDVVHHLHGFNDAQHVTGLHSLANFNEGGRLGGRRAVEGADHRRANQVTGRLRRGGFDNRGGSRRCGRGRRSGDRGLEILLGHGDLLAVPADPHGFFAFVNFQLVDAGLFKQFDEFLYFADIHWFLRSRAMWVNSILFEFAYSRLQSQRIAFSSQSADNSLGDVRKIGVMAEGFASVHIGKMHFDEWDAHRQQCVTYCDAGMGKGGGIDDDEVDCLVPGGMDAVDQHMFGVALQRLQLVTITLGLLDQATVALRQGDRAVDTGFAATEQVEIGSLQNQEAGHSEYSGRWLEMDSTVINGRRVCRIRWELSRSSGMPP